MAEHTLILHGIGGSHAYGLNREGSDEDHIGIFGYPTSAFWNLTKPPMSIVHHEPDEALHELEKFLSLAAKCNPTVLEILALDRYDRRSIWGNLLIEQRSMFFSAHYVQNAFIGYAEAQFRKMVAAWENNQSEARAKSSKNARHMIRLLEQGQHLYTTGELRVKVPDPQRYWDYEHYNHDQLREEFVKHWGNFIASETVLPDKPDFDRINSILYAYRKAH